MTTLRSGQMFIVTVAAMLFPSLATAQDSRLVGRLDSATALAVTHLADSVRRAGLPSEPLIAAALEGATRHAEADRILAAVHALAAALDTAQRTLGKRSADEELVSAAGALVAGVRPSALQDFRLARKRGSLAVPLVIVADLVARGIPSDTVVRVVAAALRGGMDDEALSAFRVSVGRDISDGRSPLQALQAHRPSAARTGRSKLPRFPVLKPPVRRGGVPMR